MTIAHRTDANVLARRLSGFVTLSGEEIAAIEAAANGQVRIAQAKRDLVREGDSPRVLRLVRSCWAARYKTLPDGRRQLVAFLVPGDLCDLNNYILEQMDHSIGALTEVAYVEIPHARVHALSEGRPRVAQALWWQLLVGMAVEREWILNLGQRTAIERLAHLFCEMYRRLEAVGLADDGHYELPITQLDLAEATGLTAVHVNRTLQEMRTRGLIVLRERMLTIPDLHELETLAMFTDEYLHLGKVGAHLTANRPELRVAE